MTPAQTVFVVALSAVTLVIVVFSAFVVSSTIWGNRWYPKRHNRE